MKRRTYLRSACVMGTFGLAGCFGVGSDDSPTILDPPDHGVDSEVLAYPAYNEEFPEVTVPSPLHDREVTTTEFEDERHALMTFVFTRCPGPCPILTTNLAHVQADATENGYSSAVTLLTVTFDPEYDTAEQLREFSEEQGADPNDENWQFLRPESEERAKEVVNETFGVGFEKTDAYTDSEDEDHDSDDNHNDHDDHDDDLDEDQDDHEMEFAHLELTILANRDGYVERAYQGAAETEPSTVIDDLATVRRGFE
jgi:protein SCO1/2